MVLPSTFFIQSNKLGRRGILHAIGRLRLAIKMSNEFSKMSQSKASVLYKYEKSFKLSSFLFVMNYQGIFIVLSLVQKPRISSFKKLKLCKYCCVSWQYMQIAVVIPERYLLLLVSSLLFRAVAYTKPRELLSAMFMMALFSLSSASAHPSSYICNDEW